MILLVYPYRPPGGVGPLAMSDFAFILEILAMFLKKKKNISKKFVLISAKQKVDSILYVNQLNQNNVNLLSNFFYTL